MDSNLYAYCSIGDMENELDVLDWMVNQKADETIELIERDTLFEYINTKDFLAVVFCKHMQD